MPRTVEEEYLHSLWADPKPQQDEPVLAGSKVIQKAHARPTYQQLAASGNPISAQLPRATLHVTPDTLHSPAGTGLPKATASSASLAGSPGSSPTRTTRAGSTGSTLRTTGRETTASPSRPTAQPADDGVDLDAAALAQEVDGVISSVTTREEEFQDAALAAATATEVAHKMAAEIQALEEEEQALLHAKPPAPERLRQVQKWAAQRKAALAAQQEMCSAASAAAAGAEASLRAAEAELDFMADMRQALDATLAVDEGARRAVMDALRGREERAARGYIARLEREAARLAQLKEEQEAKREATVQAAEEMRELAVERLTKGLERVKRHLAKGQALLDAQHEARRGAVLGLKASLAQVRAEVARKAALFQAVQKQRREMREKAFQDLMEQGLNPYEVARRKDILAQATRQRAALNARIQARQEKIAAQLAKEEEARTRAIAAAEAEREILRRFQKEQGRSAVEERVDKYMRSHTVSGQAMLDPTGRLPVDPSVAVTAKTKDFGAGRSSQALLDKISAAHPDVHPKALLVPVKYRSGEFYEDDEEDELISEQGDARSRGTTWYTTSGGMSMRSADKSGVGTLASGGFGGKKKSGWNTFEQKPLSKLERTMVDAAKTRHREAIAAPKVMMGKTFGGDAFIATPPLVEFKDFDVGSTYTASVTVTNRSYAKNTFRVLEVPPEHGNVLEVNYQLPGHLATGVSRDITITFTPKSNQDIDTHIELLAETGPFRIPVKCLCKKAQMSVSSPEVDFGPGVILGESASRTITLSNEGALDVEFTVASEDDPSQAVADTTPFNITPTHGTVQGYQRVMLNIAFLPSAAAPAARSLLITFRSLHQRKLHVPPCALRLKGIGRDVPMFLERDVIDFKCVMVDHTYREKLVVWNRGKTAMKISVANRPVVSDYIEFSPDFGFVQVGQGFPITVLFKPRASMLQQCARYALQPGDSEFNFPFKLVIPDQKLPVTFTVCAHVTTTDLVFSPPALDFGACVMAEDTGVVLHVTNPSALPQTFGFVGLPSTIRVSPNDGFGFILPGETVERIVSFQPPIPGPQSLAITAKSLAGRTFTLPVTAVGIQPSLSLSHNKIAFPATPVQDVRTCAVVLRNNTATPQAFEFGVPADSALHFIPRVGEVPPSSSLRIQIDFAPPGDAASAGSPRGSTDGNTGDGASADKPASPPVAAPAPAGKAPAASKAAKAAPPPPVAPPPEAEGTEGAEGGEGDYDVDDGDEGPTDDPNAWYSWRNFSVPCFIRPPMTGGGGAAPGTGTGTGAGVGGAAEAPRTRTTSSSGYGGVTGAPQGEPQVLHLSVTTCAVRPDLVLRTELPWVTNKRCYKLDFGPVPVGQRVTRSVQLLNQGNSTIPLGSEPLDTRQVFSVVAAWRNLAAGAAVRCLLAFQPQERADYMQVLTITSPRTQLRIALTGQGIAPQLKLDPPHALTAGLDLGDVAKGESGEAKFSITNVCPFPLSWAARFRGVCDPNVQNSVPFFCRPAAGTLAQGEACEVVVVFRPTQQRPYYADVLQLDVPNQQEQLHIPLRGRGWEQGIYLCGPDFPPPSEDPLLEHQLAAMAEAAIAAQHAAAAPDGSEPPSVPVPVPGPGARTPTPHAIGRPGTPSPLAVPPLGFVPMAPLPPANPTLVATFPHALHLDEAGTYTLEVGSLKSAAFGAAPGEVAVEITSPAAAAGGWTIDPPRIALGAGEKKSIAITYRVPAVLHPGMAGFLGAAEHVELLVQATLKGGSPPTPTPDGRKVPLCFRFMVLPSPRAPGDALPPGVRSGSSADELPTTLPAGDKKAPARKGKA